MSSLPQKFFKWSRSCADFCNVAWIRSSSLRLNVCELSYPLRFCRDDGVALEAMLPDDCKSSFPYSSGGDGGRRLLAAAEDAVDEVRTRTSDWPNHSVDTRSPLRGILPDDGDGSSCSSSSACSARSVHSLGVDDAMGGGGGACCCCCCCCCCVDGAMLSFRMIPSAASSCLSSLRNRCS